MWIFILLAFSVAAVDEFDFSKLKNHPEALENAKQFKAAHEYFL